MARLLILNESYPDDLLSGRDLRVYRLCSALLRTHECFLVSFDSERHAKDLMPLDFADMVTLPGIKKTNPSFHRHFRLSNEHFLRDAWPHEFKRSLDTVRDQQGKWEIEGVIDFTGEMSELVLPLTQPKLLDRADCDTLMLERRLAARSTNMSIRERFALRLSLHRQRHREKALVHGFNVVTTISEADRQKFIELSACDPSRIRIVKNGVDEVALDLGKRRNESARSVVFWGNLDFPPNWTAINYFYESIFKPFLSEKNIDFYIVGRGDKSHLVNMSEDPRVKLVGFKESLFEFLIDKGVMINPMTEGSGLKNKVLEAFALCLPVVSTSLGAEAIKATPDTELFVADDPRKFADAVLELLNDETRAVQMSNAARRFVEDQYNWPRMCNEFMSVVSQVFGSSDGSQYPVPQMVMPDQ